MQVFDLQQQECADGVRLSATVESRSLEKPYKLWFEIPHSIAAGRDPANGNAFLAAMVLPAMSVGEPLHIDGNASPRLLDNVQTIQKIHHTWRIGLEVVPVTVTQTTAGRSDIAGRAGIFFSLGVDSFYTLLKHLKAGVGDDATTHLVLIEGFDKRVPDQSAYYRILAERARSVADELRKELAIIRTNVRPLLERFVPWGAVGHGAAIAACGLAASNAFQELLIAASFTLSTLEPWGSHPSLDHLWSTEGTSFRHHGCDASRIDKLRVCARSPVAMRHLRVCYRNESGSYNCGACEKCIRTMMGLRAIGALARCATLPEDFDVSRFVVRHRWELEAARQMLEAIRSGESRAPADEARRLQASISNAMKAYEDSEADIRREEQRLRALDAEVRRVTARPGFAVLIDDDRLRSLLQSRLPVCPFPEVDGVFQGPPPDDETAVSELERLRAAGAHHLIIVDSSFWWLDYYPRFADFLRRQFPFTNHDSGLITFKLVEEAEFAADDGVDRNHTTPRTIPAEELVR